MPRKRQPPQELRIVERTYPADGGPEPLIEALLFLLNRARNQNAAPVPLDSTGGMADRDVGKDLDLQ